MSHSNLISTCKIDNARNVINDSASLSKRPFTKKSNIELVEALRSNFSLAKDAEDPRDQSGSFSDEDVRQSSSRSSHPDHWTTSREDSVFVPSIDFSLSGLLEERSQYDITVKLFFLPGSSELSRCKHVQEAVDLVLKELHVSSLDLLIVSFPGISFEPTNECPDDVVGRGSIDMDAIVETWKFLERLQSQGTILRVGVAEFGQHRLQEFLSRITIRPAVDQINVPDACMVPKDLIAYAKTQNIALFTHSDCTNILPEGTIRKLLGSFGADSLPNAVNDPDPWRLKGDIEPQWVIRYTAIVQNRGVIENKGYFAMAELIG